MQNTIKIILFLLIISFSYSCGQTLIIANNKNHEIYVNNVCKGKGEAKIIRTGTPKKIIIEARDNGTVVSRKIVKRKFKFSTFLIGYCTYGVGALFALKYPEQILLIESNNIIPATKNTSIWKKPSQNWNKK